MMRLALPVVFASVLAVGWAREGWALLGTGVLCAIIVVGLVLWVDRK